MPSSATATRASTTTTTKTTGRARRRGLRRRRRGLGGRAAAPGGTTGPRGGQVMRLGGALDAGLDDGRGGGHGGGTVRRGLRRRAVCATVGATGRGRRQRALAGAQHDDGDVVVPAARVRRDRRACPRPARRAALPTMPRISLVLDQIAEPVGAQDEGVARRRGARAAGRSSASTSAAMPSARVIRFASGWCAACCSVRGPRSTSSCTIEWSFVTRKICPSCTRYTRLSPTCATSVPCACMSTATAVEPGRPMATSLVAHHVDAAARLLDGAPAAPAPGGVRVRRAARTPRRLSRARAPPPRARAAWPPIPSHDDAEVAEARLAVPARVLVDLLVGIAARIGPLGVLDRREPGRRLHRHHPALSRFELHGELDGSEAERSARGHLASTPPARCARPATHVPLFDVSSRTRSCPPRSFSVACTPLTRGSLR